MKIRNYLDCLCDKQLWRILRIFEQGATFITGRKMSYILELNHKTCTKYLDMLSEASILDKKVVGKAYIYMLADNYFTKKVILPILRKEKVLFDKIIKYFVYAIISLIYNIST